MTVKLVGLVIALTIGAILIGNVMPVGITETTADDTYNLTQDEGTKYVVVDQKLNSTVTASSAGASATIELEDADGSTVSNSVNVGETVTYSISGDEVDVTVNSVTSATPNVIDVTYDVPPDYGWDSASQSIWSLIPVFLILGALVLLAGITMRQM